MSKESLDVGLGLFRMDTTKSCAEMDQLIKAWLIYIYL